MCEERGYNPIQAMMNTAEIALTKFIEEEKAVASGKMSPMESKANSYLALHLKCAAEIGNYIFPKLKAVEIRKQDLTAGMNDYEKLQAMKEAVTAMEAKLKAQEVKADVVDGNG